MARSLSPLALISGTSTGEGHGVFGIDPDRLAVIGDGAVEVALVAEDEPSTGVGPGEFGIEPDHLAEVGEGAVVVALVAEGDTSTQEGQGQAGIDPDRLIVVGDGVVQVVPVAITIAPTGVVGRLVASLPFPGIDALGTVGNPGLGIARRLAVGGG